MVDCLRLGLTYDGDRAPARSWPSPVTDRQPSHGMAMRTYGVEVRFYQELGAPAAGARPPPPRAHRPHHGGLVLLLEDLAPAQQGDQVAGFRWTRPALVVARRPACTHRSRATPGLDRLEWRSRGPRSPRTPMQAMITVLWPNFVERYGGDLDDDVVAMGGRFVAALAAYYDHRPEPHTVIHNDYRLNNLLSAPPRAARRWRSSTGRRSASAPELLDVATSSGAGLPVEDRRPLRRAGPGTTTRSVVVAVDGYEPTGAGPTTGLRCAGFHMAVLASMIVQRTDRGDACSSPWPAAHGRQILDLNSGGSCCAERRRTPGASSPTWIDAGGEDAVA